MLRLRSPIALLVLLGIAGGSAAALSPQSSGPPHLPLDMSVWHRRDYARCRGAGRVSIGATGVSIEVDDSALKYWQLPTLLGPMPVNEEQGWLRRCDRPPSSFANEALQQARSLGSVIEVGDYPWVSWRWLVDHALDDSRTADREGRIQGRGDDFAAKVGFQMLPKGGDEIRELAYVWTRTIPRETVLVQEAGALFWKFRFYRIVAESGDEHAGTWRTVTRNLVEDYRRVWPDEEPGTLLRVFLMTDGDNTNVRVKGEYADIVLHRQQPPELPDDR